MIADSLESESNRSRCRLEFEVRNHPGEDSRYGDVQNRADDERQDDAAGQIFLRILDFFSRRRNSIETDVSEEDDGCAGKDTRPAIRHEGNPVGCIDMAEAQGQEQGDDS